MLWWTLQQLKSSDWQKRAEAADRLEAAKNRKAAPALARALEDENQQVRLAVIRALAALHHSASAEPLGAALAGLSKRAKEKRTSAEGGEYEAIAVALGTLGEAATPSLLRVLDSEDREARRWAAHALGLAKDPRAVEPLVRHLADDRSETRKAAALALGSIGNRQALDPLVKALANRDHETRRAVAIALGKIGDAQATDALRVISEDPNEPVQLAVIEALGRIGGLRAGTVLRTILDGGRKNVRDAASAALNALKFAPANAEERAAVAVVTGDFEAAVREGSSAVPALASALASQDTSRRKLAAEALGRLRAADAVEPLLRALRDHDPAVQEAAVEALVHIGLAALDGLTGLLSHHDPTIQILAARALGRLGDPRSAGALLDVIEQNQVISNQYPELLDVVRAAVEALGEILRQDVAITTADLQRLAGLPDIRVQGADHDPARPAVDCAALRELAGKRNGRH
jgi:HEAT repeat protein